MRSLSFLVCVTALLGCGDEPLAQVVVRMTADEAVRARAATLRIRAWNQEGASVYSRMFGLMGDPPEASFPVAVPLSPLGGDASRRFLFEGALLDGDGALFQVQRALSGYVPRAVRELPMRFTDSCSGVIDCADAETCWDGSCRGACVEPVEAGTVDRIEPFDGCAAIVPAEPSSPSACDDAYVSARLCDGFESGASIAWDLSDVVGGVIAPDTSNAYRGASALRAHIDGATSTANLSATSALGAISSGEIWMRAFVYVPSGVTIEGVDLFSVTNGTGSWRGVFVQLDSGGRPSLWVSAADRSVGPSATPIDRDAWVCMVLHVVVSAGVGAADLEVGGTQLLAATGIATLPETSLSFATIGLASVTAASTQGSADVYYDEVVLDTSPIGCRP